MVNMELYELFNIIKDQSEIGAAKNIEKTKPGEDLISQRKAFFDFGGESRVRRWVRQNIVNPTRSGAHKRSKILYSRAELLCADQAEKLKVIINR